MNADRIPFNKPYLSGKELEYITSAHRNGHLAGDVAQQGRAKNNNNGKALHEFQQYRATEYDDGNADSEAKRKK